MGEVLGLVKQARTAKSALQNSLGVRGGEDNYDPGVNLPPPPNLSIAASAQDPGQISQPQPQGMAIAMPDMSQDTSSGMSMTTPTPQSAPVDNPYVPDTPKELAGGDENPDITVTGDRFQPKGESVLGKIADTLLLLRGRQPVFRQRTDAANLREAMKGYDRDPDAAIRRVNLVDADAAQKLRESRERMEANRQLAQERRLAIQEKGFDRLSSMTGAISNAKDPAKAYTQLLPTLRKYATQYSLDGNSMFPDTYDPQAVGAIRQGGLSAYQQEALSNQDNNAAETKRYHDAQIELAKGRLSLSEQRAEQSGQKTGGIKRVLNPRTGQAVGTLSSDGRFAALQAEDGQWYAFRLTTPGDISTRVRFPEQDANLRERLRKNKLGGK